jgi:sugar lactone lactonase YvrE
LAEERQPESKKGEKIVRQLKAAERMRRKRILLIILLILLLMLLLFLYFQLTKKEIPLPSIEIAQTERVLPPDFLFFFDGSPTHRMHRPTDVKVNKTNRLVYVTDTLNSRVSVFDEDGNFQFAFDKAGKVKLERPLYIAFDRDGNVYITERRNQKIFVFTPTGRFIREFIPKNVNRNAWQPNGIFIDTDNRVYVTEIELKHHIQVFDINGNLLLDFGESGAPNIMKAGIGLFNFPNGIVADDKFIYISDSTNRRVQVFTKQGKAVKIWPTGGQPRGIDIGYMDRIHIVDAVGHDVMVYDKDGNFLVQFGSVGNDRGQLFYPNGIGTSGRRIYVADTWNHRVDVWAWRPVVTAPPVAREIPSWSWLALLLLLLPFLFRRPRNVASRDFISAAIERGKLHVVQKELKKLYVVDLVYETYKDAEVEGVKLGELLVVGRYPERYIEEIRNIDSSIDYETAATIALARHRRRKKRFFVESEVMRRVADEFKIRNYNLDEFLEAFGYEVEERNVSE